MSKIKQKTKRYLKLTLANPAKSPNKLNFGCGAEQRQLTIQNSVSSSLCRYHISLVELLAACAEGKNVYTEIKCTSLLPLEDVVRVVTHEDCITEVPASRSSRARGSSSGNND